MSLIKNWDSAPLHPLLQNSGENTAVIANGNLSIDEGKILRTHLAVLRLVHTSTGMLRQIQACRNYSYGRTTLTFLLRIPYIGR